MRLARLGKYTGENHPRWKGGKDIMANGYVRVTTKPYTRETEHRLVMEKHLGRKLKSEEHIHHINGIKTDNRIENLQIITNSEHMSISNKKDMSNRICFVCGSSKTRIAKGKYYQWYLFNDNYLCARCYDKISIFPPQPSNVSEFPFDGIER